jgi:cyclophilin family peptidyl-prolyl cis-trans isomerase
LLASGEKAFEAEPAANREAADMLAMLAQSLVTARDEIAVEQHKPHELTDNFYRARELAELLLENGYDEETLYDPAGIAAYALNEFDDAEKYLNLARRKKRLSMLGRQYLPNIKACKQHWAEEQEIRKAEAEADDLPRVKLTTSKGDVVLELFENEAPNTVANFISLVDKGFYDGVVFHRVLPGFMAQGGCPNGDGSGGPGYTIPCECRQPGYRRHFGGSLSMAKKPDPDTGGSQFFITFVPTSFLDGQHTVFGRVVEGLDVVFNLQRRDPGLRDSPEPDRIIKAEVLRRRDHEYVPKKVGDEFDR